MATYNRNVNRQQSRAVPVRSTAPSRISVEDQARQLADSIIAERDAERRVSRLGKIYTRFDEVDDVLANNVETVTRGLFSGDVASLTTISKATLTAAQERYYFQLNDTNGISQLSIAYGHFAGSGSAFTDSSLNNDTPSRAIYKQYAQTLLEPNDKKFTINGVDTDSIYVFNFNRARIREKLDPGNFEITLRHISASADGVDGAEISSSNFIQIIDDSSLTSATLGESGQVYNLISGSLDTAAGIHNSSAPTYFGLLYPQHGVAILNATQLDKKVGDGGIDLQTDTSTVEGFNIRKLFTAVSSSNGATSATHTGGIQARSSEAVKSTYYFVRAKNAEFNYSNNPSFVTGNLGQLAYNSFKNDPQVYITSVGLYNDRRELLAVAKLSQPLLKNYTREALIKVKLDF